MSVSLTIDQLNEQIKEIEANSMDNSMRVARIHPETWSELTTAYPYRERLIPIGLWGQIRVIETELVPKNMIVFLRDDQESSDG